MSADRGVMPQILPADELGEPQELCGVPGCIRWATMAYEHKQDEAARLPLCGYHWGRALHYTRPPAAPRGGGEP